MMIVLFEDELAQQLEPVTIGKPAFAITCGGYRLVDLVRMVGTPLRAVVRPHLAEMVGDYELSKPSAGDADQTVLALNARVVPSVAALEQIKQLVSRKQPGIAMTGPSVAAAIIPKAAFSSGTSSNGTSIESAIQSLAGLGLPTLEAELPLLDFPHDIIRYHQLSVRESLEHRIAQWNFEQHLDGVFCARGSKLNKFLVNDTLSGPIV